MKSGSLKTFIQQHWALSMAIVAIVFALAVALGWWLFLQTRISSEPEAAVTKNGFDLSQATVPVDQIVSGGPGRDGIPAIDEPKFTSVDDATDIPDDGLGIFLNIDGEQRYYPYNILTWHEIVNDEFGDMPVAVTFCPLCGSAITFDRRIEGETARFGVSGLLYESNLLMYDDTTESLWGQTLGEAVSGPRVGMKLERLPTQLLDFATVKESYPEAKILSTDTGYNRNYDINPYGEYDESDELLFDVSVSDTRLPTKTIMYVIPFDGHSVALEQLKLKRGESASGDFFGKKLEVRKDENGEIFATVDGALQPGYFEMWFSWATQHQDDGELWKIDE